MKTILILIFTTMLSCQSQSDFDIMNIKLNQDKVTSIIPKEIESSTFDAGLSGGDNKFTSISSEKILIFNGVNLAGKNPKAYLDNNIFLKFNKHDSIITKYTLNVFTTKESKELLRTLKERFGNPNYTGYKFAEDKKNDNPDTFIWEDKKNEILYHLDYKTMDFGIETNLNALPIKEDGNGFPALSGIYYWEDYLLKRNKRKDDPNYTYQQFIIDETEKDSDNLYNKLSK